MLANISNNTKPSYSKSTYTFSNIIHSERKPEHWGAVYCHQCLCKTVYYLTNDWKWCEIMFYHSSKRFCLFELLCLKRKYHARLRHFTFCIVKICLYFAVISVCWQPVPNSQNSEGLKLKEDPQLLLYLAGYFSCSKCLNYITCSVKWQSQLNPWCFK